MYAQFFGNYLLSRNVVTAEQLVQALGQLSTEHVKMGTLAIHEGYMTATEVEQVLILQTHQDKRFGELAVEIGLLSEDEVLSLLKTQGPDFLLLGQIFVENNIITNQELENLLVDYQSENELIELDITTEQKESIEKLIERFFLTAERPISNLDSKYIALFFNNLIRFIGDDFTPATPTLCQEYPVNFCVSQKINGGYSLRSYLDMDESTAIAFASRYVDDDFDEFDEYVRASLDDFLNLHNGLFNVNLSNESSLELSLEPPAVVEKSLLTFDDDAFLIPIIFPFGTIHFILSFESSNEL